MEIVKPTENLEHLNQNIKDDFYKVPNLNFDVEKHHFFGDDFYQIFVVLASENGAKIELFSYSYR